MEPTFVMQLVGCSASSTIVHLKVYLEEVPFMKNNRAQSAYDARLHDKIDGNMIRF